jgi:hypothetical protein
VREREDNLKIPSRKYLLCIGVENTGRCTLMRQDNKRIAEHILMEASQDVFVNVSVVGEEGGCPYSGEETGGMFIVVLTSAPNRGCGLEYRFIL